MKNLSRIDFRDRIEAIARARKIFIPHITNNISVAFDIYQEVLAETKRILDLHSKIDGDRMRTMLDDYVRPECPECSTGMMLRPVTTPKGPANVYGYKSCWECVECGFEQYSFKTVAEQIKRLGRKPEIKG